MKSIIKQIFICTAIVISIGFSSCNEDFLVLYPETSIVSGTYYKTPTHFEQALTASYEGLRTVALQGIWMDEMRADNCHFTRFSSDRSFLEQFEYVGMFLDTEVYGNPIRDRYNGIYTSIARVNTILDRLDGSELTNEQKTAISVEAKFLRAFYYFDLVTHYGPVPLMLKEVTAAADAFVGNSTIDAIYTQILRDVTDAIDGGLPAVTAFPASGRATLGAAKMLRAYVNMSKPVKDYPAAEQDLKDIVAMPYGLENDFADIYSLGNKNGKEIIFAVQFMMDGTSGQQNTIPWRLIPMCTNNLVLMGFNVQNSIGIRGGWCVPTQEFIDSYEAGDKRLDATVAVAQGVGPEQLRVDGAPNHVLTYSAYKTAGPAAGKDYHYFTNKYYHPPYTFGSQAGDNFQVYRYADALLLLAECLVEQNRAGDALPYLDEVRTRAGLGSVPATKQSVSDERRHELAFENKRWTDLIRTGQAVEVMTEFGKYIRTVDAGVPGNAFDVNASKLLYAFPERELRLNRNLKQNPGYRDYY